MRTRMTALAVTLYWLLPPHAAGGQPGQAASATAPGTTGSAVERLPAHARVAGVPVGGLAPAQARALLARRLASTKRAGIVLTDGARRQRRARGALGIVPDVEAMVASAKENRGPVPLRWRVDRSALQAALRRIAPSFETWGRSARIAEQRGHIKIVPAAPAHILDAPTSAQRIAALLERQPQVRLLPVTIKKRPPAVTEANLKGITGRLSRFTTQFDIHKAKRVHNIHVAVAGIDGRVLKPGQVFSLNDAVGPRTHQNGFLTAPVFENGREVPGIGGGVSQVTGTLFNAALMAGLPIVQYQTHSRPVHYLPIGRDATVGYGLFDMKFKNSTAAPLYIAFAATGSMLTASLYGAKMPGQRISLRVIARRPGPRRIEAELYRTIRRNGAVVRKERIGRSHYDWKPDIPNE